MAHDVARAQRASGGKFLAQGGWAESAVGMGLRCGVERGSSGWMRRDGPLVLVLGAQAQAQAQARALVNDRRDPAAMNGNHVSSHKGPPPPRQTIPPKLSSSPPRPPIPRPPCARPSRRHLRQPSEPRPCTCLNARRIRPARPAIQGPRTQLPAP